MFEGILHQHAENNLDVPVYAAGMLQCSIPPKIRRMGCGEYL